MDYLWFPDSALTNHNAGIPASTSGKSGAAMPVQGEDFKLEFQGM